MLQFNTFIITYHQIDYPCNVWSLHVASLYSYVKVQHLKMIKCVHRYLSNSLLSNEIICVSHQSGKLHSTSPLGFNSCTKNTKYGVGQISNVFLFRVSRFDFEMSMCTFSGNMHQRMGNCLPSLMVMVKIANWTLWRKKSRRPMHSLCCSKELMTGLMLLVRKCCVKWKYHCEKENYRNMKNSAKSKNEKFFFYPVITRLH